MVATSVVVWGTLEDACGWICIEQGRGKSNQTVFHLVEIVMSARETRINLIGYNRGIAFLKRFHKKKDNLVYRSPALAPSQSFLTSSLSSFHPSTSTAGGEERMSCRPSGLAERPLGRRQRRRGVRLPCPAGSDRSSCSTKSVFPPLAEPLSKLLSRLIRAHLEEIGDEVALKLGGRSLADVGSLDQ